MDLFSMLWTSICSVLASDEFRGFGLLTAVVVAITSVISVKITARKKQTADLMFGTRADEKLGNGYKCLQKLHNKTGMNIRSLAKKKNRNSEEANHVRYVLNHWERVFVGVRQGIYDEGMLHESNYTIVVNTFDQARSYIEAVREKDARPTTWQCFEWGVKRWKKKKLKIIQKD